eukprot:CAMPEP_0168419738 /NCGR_PEP_ID=MMETSP0228-20121227/32420_1 /TAXON_ID=133427 /ORGANISM="Protoceratium reticulatum, Strain CCCM 535 (=CCMP 1889)" /LENGTH=181 /DNA_ID=CAMNT_0008433623 /DNA_START=46 /DNA_END=588 /DNA_ORIENTATION=+
MQPSHQRQGCLSSCLFAGKPCQLAWIGPLTSRPLRTGIGGPAARSGRASELHRGTPRGRTTRAAGRSGAWDDWIPDLPKEYQEIGPLKLGPRPRPGGVVVMALLFTVLQLQSQDLALIKRMDADSNRFVTLTEFQSSWAELQPAEPADPNAVFQAFDLDGDGEISAKEWVRSINSTPKLKA